MTILKTIKQENETRIQFRKEESHLSYRPERALEFSSQSSRTIYPAGVRHHTEYSS